MKNFIKAVALDICCIICKTLRLVILLSLSVVATVIEISVTLMHYIHAGFTWIAVTVLRKITGDEDKLDLECSIVYIICRYSKAYLATTKLFHMMAKSEMDDEIFEEGEEA